MLIFILAGQTHRCCLCICAIKHLSHFVYVYCFPASDHDPRCMSGLLSALRNHRLEFPSSALSISTIGYLITVKPCDEKPSLKCINFKHCQKHESWEVFFFFTGFKSEGVCRSPWRYETIL